MQYRQKQDRFQLEFTCLDQMVAPDSFARVVDAFVDTLDVKTLGFTNHTLNAEGNIPYHTTDLIKLYLYGYRNGIRSCRKLAHACITNIEVMWMIGKLQPHLKTISDFRKENPQASHNKINSSHFV